MNIPQWTLGDRLRKARQATGLSREEFADQILVSERTVANYETGATTHPKKLILQQWAEATDVPYWWLVGDQEPAVVGGRRSGCTYGADVIDLDDWGRRSDWIYVSPDQLALDLTPNAAAA